MDNLRAVIYARYSSHNQKEISVEGQLRVCREYASKKGYMVIGEYIDRALSGKTDARPDFQRMIHDSGKQKFDILICYKLNRFARDRYDSAVYKARLKKNGVKVVYANESIPEGPEGIILESMLEGLAEFYSAELAQNVNRGMYDTAMKCQSVGGRITFGYKVGPDKKFYIDEAAAPIVQQIFDMWNAGERMKDITERVNGYGIKTPMGYAFSNVTIASIIGNRRYTGVYMWKNVIIEGGMPRIISDDVFAAAQVRAEAGRARIRSGRPKEAYELTTKLFCGYCETAMIGESGKSGGNGSTYLYYTCNHRKKDHACAKKNVRREPLEEAVVDLTRRHVLRTDIINRIIDAILAIEAEEQKNGLSAALAAQLKEVESGIKNIIKAIEQGAFSPMLSKRLDDLQAEKENLELSIARESLAASSVTRDELLYWFSRFSVGDPETAEYRRRLVDTFINAIYLTDDEICIIYNYKNGLDRVRLADLPQFIAQKKALPESSSNACFGGA